MSTVFEKPLSAVDAHDQEMAQEYLELLESQAPINDQRECEKDVSHSTNQKTLAGMKFDLKHGCIHIRLLNNDHIFMFMSSSMWKSILLFASGIGHLLKDILPEAYQVYDAKLKELDRFAEGEIAYSRTVATSKFLKTLVKVSFFKGKPYIFSEVGANPSPNSRETSPTPDRQSSRTQTVFYPTKGGTLTFDWNEDDPKGMLEWAILCQSLSC